MSWKETYSVDVTITHTGNIGPAWPVWITLVIYGTSLHVAPFCVDLSISRSSFIEAVTFMIRARTGDKWSNSIFATDGLKI